MCVSRLHRVVATGDDGRVTVIDLDGRESLVSLLVLDGDAPRVDDWLVVHSGYAIDRVDANEARAIAEEISATHRAPDERK